jgi:hypothetical protein
MSAALTMACAASGRLRLWPAETASARLLRRLAAQRGVLAAAAEAQDGFRGGPTSGG